MKTILLLITISVTTSSFAQDNDTTNYLKTELYLGLSSSEDNFPITKWNDFKREQLERILNGYTEIEGRGFWKNDAGKAFHQKSTIIVYIHQDTDAQRDSIDKVVNLIKSEFNQESVYRVTQEVQLQY